MLDDEWHRLAIVSLPFEHEDMEFWERLSKLTDGTENPPFGVVCQFMKTLLCLLHSNVDVERIFSEVNNIKTKKRNRLKLKTLQAILQVKQGVRESGRCTKFSPSQDARQLMAAHTLYDCSESDSD